MANHQYLDLREQDYLALPAEQRARIVAQVMARARVERSLALHRMIGRMAARLRTIFRPAAHVPPPDGVRP